MLDTSALNRLGIARQILVARQAVDRAAGDPKSRGIVELTRRRLGALRERLMGRASSPLDMALAEGPAMLANEVDGAEKSDDMAHRARIGSYAEALSGLLSRLDHDERRIGASDGANDWLAIHGRSTALKGDTDGDNALIAQFTDAGRLDSDMLARTKEVAARATGLRGMEFFKALELLAPDHSVKLKAIADKRIELLNVYESARKQLVAEVNRQRSQGVFTSMDEGVVAELNAKADSEFEAYDQVVQERNDAIDKANEKIKQAISEAEAPLVEAGKAFIQDVLSASSVSESHADEWARSQEISKAAVARLRKMGYPVDQVRKDMAEFYRFTGGRVSSVSVESKGDRRANATEIHSHGKTAVINLGSSFDKRVLWHELAHHLEADPVALRASQRFIRNRATSQDPKTLRSLTGNKGYGSREVAFEDHFFNAYVGKVYDDATEVFSMGVESFSDPRMLGIRMGQDPETLMFVAGFLKTPVPAIGQAFAQFRDAIAEARKSATSGAEVSAEQAIKRLAQSVPFESNDDIAWAVEIGVEWMIKSMKAQQIGFMGDQRQYAVLTRRVFPIVGNRKVAGLTIIKTAKNDGRWSFSGEISIPSKDVDYARAAMALFEKNGVWPSPAALFNEARLSELG